MDPALKTKERNYLAIAGGGRRVDPRLNDRNFQPGDRVTFVRYNPETKEEGTNVSVVLTHVARFAPELFARASNETLQGGYVLIGLSRPTEATLIPPSGAVALKAWPENFAAIVQGSRVDLRAARPDIKRSSAIVYQEFLPDTGAYTGKVAARAVRHLTPWKPTEHYTPERLGEHGVAVLGWKGLEQKVEQAAAEAVVQPQQ